MKLPILQYHKLHPTHKHNDTILVEDFRLQMMLLKQFGYTTITCSELSSSLMNITKLPANPVMITFDHGHISQNIYAMAILEDQGFNAVFFVTGDKVLKSTVKENGYSDYMNIDHLRFLHEKGSEIGIHGYDDLDFSNTEPELINYDISRCVALLRTLEVPFVSALAYPQGKTPLMFWKSKKLYDILKQQRISLAFERGNGINELSTANRFSLHRTEVKGFDSARKFLNKLNHARSRWFF
jgi:peptidoglycan/xylan/chitin deacetylase (PgdA/CDA1 family)